MASRWRPEPGTLRRLRRRRARPGHGTAGVASTAALDPLLELDLPSLEMAVAWHNTDDMSQEIYNAQGVTAAANDGDPVGQLRDNSPSCHYLASTANDKRPQLATRSGHPCALFGSAGADRLLFVENSRRAFNWIWTAGDGTIMFQVEPEADGVDYVIMDSSTADEADVGLYVARTSANKVLVKLNDGAAGPMAEVTTDDTLTAAGGLQWVTITLDKSGSGNMGVQIGDGTAKTGAIGTLIADTDSEVDLYIGRRQDSASLFFRGWIGRVLFASELWDGDAIAAVKALAAQRRGAYNPLRLLGSGDGSRPEHYSNLQSWYDGDEAAGVFTDTAKTTPVASDADIGRVLANRAGNDSAHADRLGRDFVGAADASSPTWQTNEVAGGVNALEFDGTDDSLVLQASKTWMSQRRETVVYLVKNDDGTNGSHVLYGSSGSTYMTVTGSSYSGNGAQGPYWTTHPGGSANGPFGYLENDSEGYNLLSWTRDGGTMLCSVNGRARDDSGNLLDYRTETGGTTHLPTSEIGRAQIANWELDGRVVCLYRFNAGMDVATWQSFLRMVSVRKQVPSAYYDGTLISTLLYGMKAYWPLADDAADVYEFGSGTRRDLTNANCTFDGESATFNGTSAKLSIADNADVSTDGGAYFLSLWVRFDDVTRGEECLLYKSDGTNGFRLRHIGATNAIEFTHYYGGSTKVASATPGFASGTWYQIACRWLPSTGTSYVRTNDSNQGSSSGGGSNSAAEAAALTVGAEGSSNWFKGKIKGLGLWRLREPSGAEQTALYNAGTTPTYPFS